MNYSHELLVKKLIVTILTEDLVLMDQVVQRFAARATLLLDPPAGREGRPKVRSEMETNHLSLLRCSWCDSAQVNDYSVDTQLILEQFVC